MPKWRIEVPLLIAVFLDLLGFGMVIAGFQLRAQSLIPAGWPKGPIIGALFASTFIIQLIASPRWGRRSDSTGRKGIVVACTLLSGAAMLVYGQAESLAMLLVSRVLAGFGSANVAVAQAMLSDAYEAEARTAALGRIGAALSSGLVIGPAVGGFLSHHGGPALVGWIGGGASLAGAVAMAVALPNVPPKRAQEPGKRPPIDLTLLRDLPSLRPMVTIAAVAWFSLATLEGTFARLINRLFGYGELEFGIYFGYESLLSVIVQGSLLGLLAKRFRETPMLRLSYFAQGLGLALNPIAATIAAFFPPLGTLFVASTLFALGSSVANPTVNAICSRLTPEARQGELFGVLQGARAIGFVLGPIVGGALFDWNATAPYLLAGAVCVVAALLLPKVAHEKGDPVGSPR